MDLQFSIFDSYRSFMIIIPNRSFEPYFEAEEYDGFRFTSDVCLELQCTITLEKNIGIDLYISHLLDDTVASTKYYWKSFELSLEKSISLYSDDFSEIITNEVMKYISADLFTYVLAMIQTELDFSEYREDFEES